MDSYCARFVDTRQTLSVPGLADTGPASGRRLSWCHSGFVFLIE